MPSCESGARLRPVEHPIFRLHTISLFVTKLHAMPSNNKIIPPGDLQPIANDGRLYNLASEVGYWVYNDLIADLKNSGWIRFAPGFKGGLYGHPNPQIQFEGRRVCIKILGMGVGDDPLFFCERGYYLEYERSMLQDFRNAGFTFPPQPLTQQESVEFLINTCKVRPQQAEQRAHNNDLLIMEYISGTPFATQTGRFLNYYPNIEIRSHDDLHDICSALIELGDQLEKANATGLVHNDVMPPNIIFTTNCNGRIEARLVDFELAQNLNAPSPGWVNSSVDELYRERDVPISQAGRYLKNLDQHLVSKAIQLAKELAERSAMSSKQHWLVKCVEFKPGFMGFSFDFKKLLEKFA